MRAFLWAAATALALFGLGCSSDDQSKGVTIDRSFQLMIWPQATVLAGFNFRDLKKTDFYQHYSQRLDIPALNEASQRLGFDPRKDVDTLLLESDERRLLFLATGKLQLKELREHLSKLGEMHSTTYRSVPLLGDERNTLGILGTSSAIGGSGEAVRSALDQAVGRGGSIAPELQARMEAIPKSTQIWVVSRNGLPFVGMPMRSDVKSALSNIVAFISGTSAGFTFGSGAKLDATITCLSPVGAQRVHDALRGGIGLARLSTRDDQTDLLKVYDAIDVNRTGNLVQVKANWNAQELDKLMTFIPQMRSRAGQLIQ